MELLTSARTNQTYRPGPPLAALGEGFLRGFSGTQEVLLRIAQAEAPAVAALRAEADVLGRIDHPQVAKVRDRGRSESAFFLVFDGPVERSLAELVSTADLTPAAALDILVQVSDIVLALHAAGIVWGRLRPQAFQIDKAGRLRLLNLRGAAGTPTGSPLTLAEAVYLAPEQSAGDPPAAANDAYALGVLAYELLAGKPPFVGAGPTELAVKHLAEPAPDIGQVRPGLPAALVELINQCLDKMPGRRPDSMAEMHAMLSDIRAEVQAAEQERLVTCPRCAGRVPPTERCPLCQAPLEIAAPVVAKPRRKIMPYAIIGVSLIVLSCMLMSLFSGGGSTSAATAETAEASAPTATVPAATATPAPTSTPAAVPTATAAPLAAGTISVPADDVADANVDLFRARVARSASELTAELEVVGRVSEGGDARTYQVFLDADGPDSGDRTTPWPSLGADYTLIYRSGDEAGQVLRWNGQSWEGIGAAQAEIAGGRLVLRVPAEWVPATATLRYGVFAANPGANLADYAPERTKDAAEVATE